MKETHITARLNEEIKAIHDLERAYRTIKHRSSADRMAHASRELRLVEIRAELAQLKNKAGTHDPTDTAHSK